LLLLICCWSCPTLAAPALEALELSAATQATRMSTPRRATRVHWYDRAGRGMHEGCGLGTTCEAARGRSVSVRRKRGQPNTTRATPATSTADATKAAHSRSLRSAPEGGHLTPAARRSLGALQARDSEATRSSLGAPCALRRLGLVVRRASSESRPSSASETSTCSALAAPATRAAMLTSTPK
jgi:hypothetical protein